MASEGQAGKAGAGTGTSPKPARTFTCLLCNRPFQFPYATGRKPVFCSRSCQRKYRYRRRRQATSLREARKLPARPTFPRGRLPPSLEGDLGTDLLTCARCGRPPGQGEGLGRWRVRVSSASSRWPPTFWVICPAHYGE